MRTRTASRNHDEQCRLPRANRLGHPGRPRPRDYERELPAANALAPTISDDLDTPAIVNLRTPARRAINAGLDLLLYAQTEASSMEAYPQLLADLQAGSLNYTNVAQAAAAVSTRNR